MKKTFTLIALFTLSFLYAKSQRLVHIDDTTVCENLDTHNKQKIMWQDTITVYQCVDNDYWTASFKGHPVRIKYYYIHEINDERELARRIAPFRTKSDLIKRFGITDANLIIDKKVRIGMTKQMATLSWGDPDKVNTTTTAYAVDEQWVYGDNRAFLYFTNGKLTAIQN